MSFLKEFDDIFQAMLTDYINQFPEADTSQGSLIYIKSAALSSALWGIYKYIDYTEKQIFVDTADNANVDHHGAIYNISRNTGESKENYVLRVLARIRQPPAGGNANDYKQWALEVQDIKACYVFPLAQGLGTVDIVPLTDEVATSSEIPDSAKITEVTNYIDALRPVTAHTFRVLTVVPQTQAVTMTATGGSGYTDAQIEADITAELNAMEPGQTLYVAKLVGIAIAAGADTASVSVPASDVVPTNNEDMIRPGTITVNP
jgi:uncharacterized phage protein gp47/JayE